MSKLNLYNVPITNFSKCIKNYATSKLPPCTQHTSLYKVWELDQWQKQ